MQRLASALLLCLAAAPALAFDQPSRPGLEVPAHEEAEVIVIEVSAEDLADCQDTLAQVLGTSPLEADDDAIATPVSAAPAQVRCEVQ